MVTSPLLERKSYEQERAHFIIRLKERYGIELSELEYDLLTDPDLIKFNPKFKKGMDKIIGFVMINDRKVWVLKKKQNKSFATCYPEGLDENPLQAIKSCFPRTLRDLANRIYGFIQEEERTFIHKFDSIKELGIYLYTQPNNILFKGLHIKKFKNGKQNVFDTMHIIKKIIAGKSAHVQLTVTKKDVL